MQTPVVREIIRLGPKLAHDVCSDVSAIRNAIDCLIEDTNVSPEVRNKLTVVGHYVKGVSQRARQFQMITATDEPTIVDMKAELLGLRCLLARLSEPHKLEMLIEDDLWSIKAFDLQVHEIVIPVVVNARDAMTSDGDIFVSARNLRASEQIRPPGLPAECILVEIADTGIGMSLDHSRCIFDPFFSTKGPGCGFGLAQVNGVIVQLNGQIDVQSELGAGTTIRIFLPACRK